MNKYREICKCGHDKATHHEGKHDCLGMFCNDCRKYRNEWEEDPPPTPRTPTADWADDDAEFGPVTPKLWWP